MLTFFMLAMMCSACTLCWWPCCHKTVARLRAPFTALRKYTPVPTRDPRFATWYFDKTYFDDFQTVVIDGVQYLFSDATWSETAGADQVSAGPLIVQYDPNPQSLMATGGEPSEDDGGESRTVTVYDTDGNEVWSTSPFTDGDGAAEAVSAVAINGRFTNWNQSPAIPVLWVAGGNPATKLALIDVEGDILWQQDVAPYRIGNITVTSELSTGPTSVFTNAILFLQNGASMRARGIKMYDGSTTWDIPCYSSSAATTGVDLFMQDSPTSVIDIYEHTGTSLGFLPFTVPDLAGPVRSVLAGSIFFTQTPGTTTAISLPCSYWLYPTSSGMRLSAITNLGQNIAGGTIENNSKSRIVWSVDYPGYTADTVGPIANLGPVDALVVFVHNNDEDDDRWYIEYRATQDGSLIGKTYDIPTGAPSDVVELIGNRFGTHSGNIDLGYGYQNQPNVVKWQMDFFYSAAQ